MSNFFNQNPFPQLILLFSMEWSQYNWVNIYLLHLFSSRNFVQPSIWQLSQWLDILLSLSLNLFSLYFSFLCKPTCRVWSLHHNRFHHSYLLDLVLIVQSVSESTHHGTSWYVPKSWFFLLKTLLWCSMYDIGIHSDVGLNSLRFFLMCSTMMPLFFPVQVNYPHLLFWFLIWVIDPFNDQR